MQYVSNIADCYDLRQSSHHPVRCHGRYRQIVAVEFFGQNVLQVFAVEFTVLEAGLDRNRAFDITG